MTVTSLSNIIQKTSSHTIKSHTSHMNMIDVFVFRQQLKAFDLLCKTGKDLLRKV